MSLVDQYGNPTWSRRPFARAINRNNQRGFRTGGEPNKDITRLIPQGDRSTLAALSRRMVWNMGVPKSCLRQKAQFSIGAAFLPSYSGEDAKRGEMAADWLKTEWFHSPDVRCCGEWWDLLEVVSKCLDRDGESFILLTYRDDGWPALQHIPAHTIRNVPRGTPDEETIKGGEYDGARIEDGVIFDRFMTPLAYRHYYGKGEDDYEDLPAGSVIHTFDREFPEQLRGYPAFSHALSDLAHSLESTELELLRQMVVSSMYLIEKGDDLDPNDPAWETVMNTTAGTGVLVENLTPGIRRISGDSSIEAITHSNPGTIWADFQDRIMKTSVNSVWSTAMIGEAPAGGTAARLEAAVICRMYVKDRQRQLKKFGRRAVTYALAGAKSKGITGSAPNSMSWDFTVPARITVDDGREDASVLEAVQAGACTLTEYLANKGRSVREHLMQAAMDKVLATKIALEVSAREGVQIDPGDLMPKPEQKMDPANQTEPVPKP